MKTELIVTVDTEEEGLWGGEYRRVNNTVTNVHGAARFQRVCESSGIRPTYLIDAAVVQDDEAVSLLKGFQDDGRAEIGAHVHPWCNPPLEEETSRRNSFLCNLPEALQRQKITWLTDAIQDRTGQRPVSFRAGRYGLDIVGARILADLDYVVDSSVIPFSDFSAQDGPDFDDAPSDPYFVDDHDLVRPGPADSAGVLEVPVTVGYSRDGFRFAHRLRRFAARPVLRQLRCVGLVDRLGLARRIKLSPEQASGANMRVLADVRCRQAAPSLVLMLHSSSLVPGLSPYAPDNASLERLYARLSEVFAHCLGNLGCTTATLGQFGRRFSSGLRSQGGAPPRDR